MEIFALNSFAGVIAAAFVGGLVLNFMPCVLPVLALKFYALSQGGGGNATGGGGAGANARAQSLWLVLGIVLSFNLFALLIYLLQQAGGVVGWGFHFQQPIFVLAMMLLLLLFAFAQAGRVGLPLGWLADFSAGVAARFNGQDRLSNLFYGAVLVGLATPCTAPFLGTAVAFALTQGLGVIFVIFTAIALGLAAPWVLFLFAPKKLSASLTAARRFPLAPYLYWLIVLMLYGSALWLLWVLSAQIGWLAAGLIFVIAHGLLLSAQKVRLAPLLLLALLPVPAFLPTPPPLGVIVNGDLNWNPFDRARIATEQAKGKKVFVDITAKWCITCQFNKKNVLADGAVRARLNQADIYLMQGDLTKPNAAITNYLKSNQRIGIPFNALYVPNKKKPHLFSEILDKKTLLTALQP